MGGDSKYLGLWYVAPYVIGLMLFMAFPFVASFYLSFTDYNLLSDPEWVGLDNYEKLFTRDRTFDKSLRVTLTYVALTVPIKLTFALFIAVVLNYRLRGINLFRTAYYVPSILGGSIAIAVLWRYMFAQSVLISMIITGLGGRTGQLVRRPRKCALHHYASALLAVRISHGDFPRGTAIGGQIAL